MSRATCPPPLAYADDKFTGRRFATSDRSTTGAKKRRIKMVARRNSIFFFVSICLSEFNYSADSYFGLPSVPVQLPATSKPANQRPCPLSHSTLPHHVNVEPKVSITTTAYSYPYPYPCPCSCSYPFIGSHVAQSQSHRGSLGSNSPRHFSNVILSPLYYLLSLFKRRLLSAIVVYFPLE